MAPNSPSEPATLGVDLYRTDDYVSFGRVALPGLLRLIFESMLEQPLNDAEFLLSFHAVEDPRELEGEPSLTNLRGSHGFVSVRITREGRLLYQHPHAVRELVGRPLQRILARQVPDETHWGYGVSGPGLEQVPLVRPAPRPAGSVDLRSFSGRPRRFQVEEVPEDLPEADLADFGLVVGTDPPATTGLLITPQVHEGLLRTMAFSQDVEEGGFLVGRVSRARGRPDDHLVLVSEAMPAQRTGASLLQFTFTGESFLRINDALAQRDNGDRLVGWYHTHLFAATDSLGLSTIDVELHTRTFRRPWHLAGLVNIDAGTRQLRMYRWNGGAMHQLRYSVGS
jgi:hypothetical protein